MRKRFLILLFIFYSSDYIIASENICSWIDLPKQSTSFHLGYHEKSFNLVNKMIDQYHELDKLDENNLQIRSRQLGEISLALDQLATHIQDKKKSETINKLSLISRKKAEYLNRLNYIFKNGIDTYEKMNTLFTPQKHDVEGLCALPLINKVIYAPNLPSYWGLFWLEALDPCHRMLTSYYVKWKESNLNVPFFMWLEKEEIPYYIFQIKLFNDEELTHLQYNISLKDGLLQNINGEKSTLNAENEEYIYVITLDKKILISKGSQSVRHFSLTGGKPVLAAGSIKTLNGKIIYFDSESGHYQPTIFHIKQTVDILKELGATLETNVNIKYYHENKVSKISLKEFLDQFHCMAPLIESQERYILDFSLR